MTNNFFKKLDIKIVHNIQEDISIYQNKHELVQILLNIVNNSKDSFESRDIKDKYIFIEILSNKEEVTIKVKDTAGGIKEDIINRIFEPYFTTKHQAQGTGLGLYLAYIIITDKMKGKIIAENMDFDCPYEQKTYKGTIFTIVLSRVNTCTN